ncbi:MAG: ABC transporter permease subunit [Armatimonadota bacterium]|nr:ABC transporter permease [bacterium]
MSIATTARERINGTLAESIYDNPVVTREFRTRMRGWKAFTVMGSYTLLLAAFLFIHYLSIAADAGHSFQMESGSLKVGAKMFVTLTVAQAIMLMFIVPSLTSGALAQEVEKKTMELLVLTTIPSGKIVFGKQFSGFLYAMVLLFCSAPLAGICLMLGGISPGEVMATYALIAGTVFLFAAIGVFWSAIFEKTAISGVFTYGSCMFYMFVTSILGESAMYPPPRSAVFSLSLLNPIFAAYDMALTMTKVCGIEFPAWIASVATELILGSLLLLISSGHVRFRKTDKTLVIRLMLLATTLILVWLTIGSFPNFGGGRWSRANSVWEMLAAVSSIILGFMCIMACPLATGEPSRTEKSMLLYAMSGRRAFSKELGGAMSFLALWTAVVYGAFGGTLYWLTKVEHVSFDPQFWPAYLKLGVALVMIVAGVSAVGMLASSIASRRKGAAALVLVFLAFVFAGYTFLLAYHQPNEDTSAPIWQTAALWPITPIMAQCKNWDRTMPTLWWVPNDSWLVTSCIYVALGVIALSIAGTALKKFGGVQED